MFEFDKNRGKSVLSVFKIHTPKNEGKGELLRDRVALLWANVPQLRNDKPYDIMCPTTIGLEIEMEKVAEPAPFGTYLWQPINDGSLKVDGVELVSTVLPGELVGHALTEYKHWLKSNIKSEFSHRCSLHVHLGVQNLSMEQLVTLITVYLTLEEVLFKNLFLHRHDNSYCFPMGPTGFTLSDFEKAQMDPKMFKYCALNLYHLRDFGTLEFRHHPGSKNLDDIAEWINIICSMYTWSKSHSLPKLTNTLKALNIASEYDLYIRSILGTHTPAGLELDRRSMRNAVLCAKHFLADEF